MIKSRLQYIFLSILLLQISSALTLTEPLNAYNLGDKINIALSDIDSSSQGNLDITMICKNDTLNLARIPAQIFQGGASTYTFHKTITEADLEIENIHTLIGACRLEATLGTQGTVSEDFEISKEIKTTATLNKELYNPGEPIILTVNAIKANGELLEGYLRVGNGTTLEKAITAGRAQATITTAETVESGSYTLTILAYDTYQGNKLNEGRTTVSYKIKQIPTFIKTSISDEEATPGEEFEIGAQIFDQAGIEMKGTVAGRITSPTGNTKEITITSGNTHKIRFANNETPGIWTITTLYEGILDEREFQVQTIQKAEFEFEEDNVLLIRNIGNAIYNKTVTIQIGEETTELTPVMQVGEERRFDLKAPTGEYEVTITDQEEEISTSLLLTGRAISVKDLSSPGLFSTRPLAWALILLILGLGIAYLIAKKQGGGRIGKVATTLGKRVTDRIRTNARETIISSNKSPEAHSLDMTNAHIEDKRLVDLTRKRVGIAESSPTVKGEKYASAVVALKIQNYETLTEHAKTELKRIVENASGTKGLIDWRGDYIFTLYSPLVTKTYKNELLAARTAINTKTALEEHNRKFNGKFEYNIGVHSGDLVASKAGGKIKYTSMGNTISFSKRLADSNKKKVIVSDEIRKKLLRDINVERQGMIGENNTYSITEIKDRQQNEAKLQDLLKRM